MTQLRIPAVYMRGGTSKGVFFLARDLPSERDLRDRILLRAIGSPDRYGKQIDGLGGGTSSTSKVVILAGSARADSDVDYWFGQVAIDSALIDWSGNCGNLSAAVAPFAITAGLVDAPADGTAIVRIWQANIGRRIVAHVPMRAGEVEEAGDFELDGVAFAAGEIKLEFIEPAGEGPLFPTGRTLDRLEVPGSAPIEATLIQAGNPTIFVDAAALGLTGTEHPGDLANRIEVLALAEAVRAQGAVSMGLAATSAEASRERPHTPKLAYVARPERYTASDGKVIEPASIDLLARIFSMGQLHHAMTGTGVVAIAAAASIPGTLVHRLLERGPHARVRLGHPSGTVSVAAEVVSQGPAWRIEKIVLSRSARRLMEGWVRVPETPPRERRKVATT